MQKTKIEWTDYTWNPIKGLCPVDCKLPDGKSYCYARRMYQRFGWNKHIRLKKHEAIDPRDIKKPSRIFVCSTFELFHPITAVSESEYYFSMREWIFHIIEENPQHTFQILTKFPQNIDRPIPDNVWLGVTITKREELSRLTHLCKVEAKKRFVSFEPLLGFIQWNGFRLEFSSLDWIIIGQLTGHGKKYEPMGYWVNQIKFYAGYYGIPFFMKNNLKSIWGENLIQEMPQ